MKKNILLCEHFDDHQFSYPFLFPDPLEESECDVFLVQKRAVGLRVCNTEILRFY